MSGFSRTALAYMAEHAIDPAVVAQLGVTEQAGRLVYPDGRLRSLNGLDPKIKSPKGRRLKPWALVAPERPVVALVCEGESDALAAASALEGMDGPLAGKVAVVSVPGTSCPTERVVGAIRALKPDEVAVAFDADEPGRRAANKLVNGLRAAGLRAFTVEPPEGRDLADCLAGQAESERPRWLADTLVDFSTREDERQTPEIAPEPASGAPGRRTVRARAFSGIAPEQVDWLWSGRVPLGMLTLLIGDPGLGKSLLTVLLAAEVSRSGASALLLTAEDSPAHTVRPRLEAAGADLHRVLVVEARRDGLTDGLALPDDAAELSRLVGEHRAKLVVVDPLMAHLPSEVNSWRDQSVRGALAPLHRLAVEHHVAVLVVAHLNKGGGSDAVHRTGGSIGIPAAARSVLLLARDPDDPEGDRGSQRVIAHAKCNIAPLAPSLVCRVESAVASGISTARLDEIGESDTSASRLLTPKGSEATTATDDAEHFLLTELADGARSAADIKATAREAGISDKALRTARERLGIKPDKTGFSGGWEWALPEDALDPDEGRASSQGASSSNPAPGAGLALDESEGALSQIWAPSGSSGGPDEPPASAEEEAEIERLRAKFGEDRP